MVSNVFLSLRLLLKDKIHQNYPLEKFLKEDKWLFKPKVKYLKALDRLYIHLEY